MTSNSVLQDVFKSNSVVPGKLAGYNGVCNVFLTISYFVYPNSMLFSAHLRFAARYEVNMTTLESHVFFDTEKSF